MDLKSITAEQAIELVRPSGERLAGMFSGTYVPGLTVLRNEDMIIVQDGVDTATGYVMDWLDGVIRADGFIGRIGFTEYLMFQDEMEVLYNAP